MKKIINISLVIIIIFCFSLAAYKYYDYYKDDKFNAKIQNLAPEIKEVVLSNNDASEGNSADITEEDNSSSKENEELLREMNNDYKMWLQIENTDINYPVVQTSDNEYYLNHNFQGEDNISGTIFVDYQNDIEKDKNIVIYGHNMKNKTMFNNLIQYKDQQFFENNNAINIVKDGKLFKYEVCSVYVDNVKNLNIALAFNSKEDFLNYATNEISKSLYSKDISISEEENLLTLVTCSYEYTDARTVVVAVRK